MIMQRSAFLRDAAVRFEVSASTISRAFERLGLDAA
jgi:hypothetical protein